MTKQALILAAGEGQRLRPFTVDKPKGMLPIAGKPILQYVIEALVQNGVRDIVLVVGYHKKQIYDHFGSGESLGVEITYVTQSSQLGTAHSLAQAKEAAKDDFLVLSGDNLIEADTIAEFVSKKPMAILVKVVGNPARYGVVTLHNGAVERIEEKPRYPQSNIVNTGIYSFTRDIFAHIEDELDIPQVLNKMFAAGQAVSALQTEGVWLDAVYPWDILGLNSMVIGGVSIQIAGTIETAVSIKGEVRVGEGTIIRSGCYIEGPTVIGENCVIGPNACILPATSIGDNVTISPFTEVRNSVIGDDVALGTGGIIQDSVMDRGSTVGSHFSACASESEVKVEGEYHSVKVGAMVGEGCDIGDNVVAEPGVILGNRAMVRPLKIIRGVIPDGVRVV